MHKREQCRRYNPAWLQTARHDHSNDSMLLAHRQIHIRGVEWKTAQNYSHLILTDKDSALWRKDNVFNQWCWEIWTLKCRRKLVPYVLFWKKIKNLDCTAQELQIVCDPEVARGSGREWASINQQTQGVQSWAPEDGKWEEQLTNGISRKGRKLLYSKRNDKLSEETAHRVWEKNVPIISTETLSLWVSY